MSSSPGSKAPVLACFYSILTESHSDRCRLDEVPQVVSVMQQLKTPLNDLGNVVQSVPTSLACIMQDERMRVLRLWRGSVMADSIFASREKLLQLDTTPRFAITSC